MTGPLFFFSTALEPCCYLENQQERKLLTEITGNIAEAEALHEALSHKGFRRSHTMAYTPCCPQCEACIAVRIRVKDFSPDRTMRRTLRRNADLCTQLLPPKATLEQFELFSAYQQRRHALSDMAMMSPHDYQMMVEDTPVTTRILACRHESGPLLAACLMDILSDGLSAVYSFFHPDLEHRSLGTHLILQLLETARSMDLTYVYLGYWVTGSPKMAYKSRFQPLEYFIPSTGWSTTPPK